jgi:hypothetical protein
MAAGRNQFPASQRAIEARTWGHRPLRWRHFINKSRARNRRRECRRQRVGSDHRRSATDEVNGKARQPLKMALCPPVLERKILALDKTDFGRTREMGLATVRTSRATPH